MAVLSVALAVFVAAQGASGVRWVPLTPTKPAVKTAPSKPPPSPSAQPTQKLEPSLPTTQSPPTGNAQAQIHDVDGLPAASASPPTRGRLDLTCFGAGTANKASVTTVNSSSSFSGTVGTVGMVPFSGSGSGSSTVLGRRQQGYNDQVDIRLFNGDDRIRMPRTMLPPIHGGTGGWFRLKDVVADARSIRASAAVNFMNNPKVHIDRVTGTISISGKAGDYAGQCQVIDATAEPKF
jgi:hypothetical protein